MRVGAFEVDDAIHGLRNPIAISTLRPWIDAGSVGKLVLTPLGDRLKTREAGGLARPGEFFDLTRYRPTVRYDGDQRVFSVPNTAVTYARRASEPDVLFLDVLEPHMRAEDYVDSILELLSFAGVKTFCRIGAWYAGAPHTRPLRVSHSIGGVQIDPKTGRQIAQTQRYEGPTSIMNRVNEGLEERGIKNQSLMLQLPHYAQLEEDYSAAAAMLEALGELCGFSGELTEWIVGYKTRGRRQYEQLDQMVARDPELRGLLAQLEAVYDTEHGASADDSATLSPEIQQFLNEITGRMDAGEDAV